MAPHDPRFVMTCLAPDNRLRPYITGYRHFQVRLAAGECVEDAFLPRCGTLHFTLEGDPWSVRLGRKRFEAVPRASLFGPTGQAGYCTYGRGTTAWVGLTPRGWARWVTGKAGRHADRVGPLSESVLSGSSDLLGALVEGGAPKEAFDRYFLERLSHSEQEPSEVGSLAAMLEAGERTLDQMADELGLSRAALVRVSRAAFGFTPKLLVRRARFLRVFHRAQKLGRGRWLEALAGEDYSDQSHFLRDCHQFLGMSLGAFLALPGPMPLLGSQTAAAGRGGAIQKLTDGSGASEVRP